MTYKIGDKVIHSIYGLGEVVNIKEMTIRDRVEKCYAIKTPELTVWVPIDDDQHISLRSPASPKEFNSLISILSSPGEALLEDRLLRKAQLMAAIKDGKLASICRVVRDLHQYMRTTKLNDQEKDILDRAKKSLLTEWTYSLNVTMNQAQQAVEKLLQT